MVIVETIGTEYFADSCNIIPYGYIDKTVCGIGFTTVAIENNRHTIIAVPNISLVENKVNQYRGYGRSNIILFGITGESKLNNIKAVVSNTVKENKQPIKIMTTYDSLHKVDWILDKYDCDLVIDESDQIIGYANLKHNGGGDIDVITYMLEIAKLHKDKVSFISATPTPIQYMPKWMSELKQYRFEFPNSISVFPITMKKNNVVKAVKQHITKPLNLYGKTTIENISFSKVIIFINSISKAIQIIEESSVVTESGIIEIKKEDVAFICGDNAGNDIKIKSYQRVKDPTNLPKFTFITGSGVRGIDLDDKDAISVVVSDSKQHHTMFDMMSDLKQAASRQRNKLNPNYGTYIFIYNQSITELSLDESKSKIDRSVDDVKILIQQLENSKNIGGRYYELFEEIVKTNKSFSKYCYYDKVQDLYLLNENLINADRYITTELIKQYRNGFKINTAIGHTKTISHQIDIDCKDISYNSCYNHAMYYISREEDIVWTESMKLTEYASIIDSCYKKYGKAFNNQTYAKKIYNSNDSFEIVKVNLMHGRNRIKLNTLYKISDIKEILAYNYSQNQISRSPKATDISEFFSEVEFKNHKIEDKIFRCLIVKKY